MAAQVGEFTATLASTSLDQARALAEGLNYRVHIVEDDGTWSQVMFLTGRRRPKLRLVDTGRGQHLAAT